MTAEEYLGLYRQVQGCHDGSCRQGRCVRVYHLTISFYFVA